MKTKSCPLGDRLEAAFPESPSPLFLFALGLIAGLVGGYLLRKKTELETAALNSCAVFAKPTCNPISWPPPPPGVPQSPNRTLSVNVVWNTSNCGTQPTLQTGVVTVQLYQGSALRYTSTGIMAEQKSNSGDNPQTVQVMFTLGQYTGNFTAVCSVTAIFSDGVATYPPS